MASIPHPGLTTDSVETAYPDSPWVVMKFGGTSVSTGARWEVIRELVRERLAQGLRPVIVHSAIAGVSNTLEEVIAAAIKGDAASELERVRDRHEQLAGELGVAMSVLDGLLADLSQLVSGIQLVGEASPRVRARVMAMGELMSTRLSSEYLQTQGISSTLVDARDLLCSRPTQNTSERARFLSAVCDWEPDEEFIDQVARYEGVVVTQGFIARNPQGDLVLLGRGGSDTSAAYLAAKLRARRLEVWTDVPGLFSANPKTIPSARLLRRLHFSEAQEIASAGGAVLHPRSIPPVRHSGIPLFLRSTQEPALEGTMLSAALGDDAAQLKAISFRTGLTLISMESMAMWQEVGFMANAFEKFRAHGVSVDLVSTSESNVTVSIDTMVDLIDDDVLDALAEDLKTICRVKIIDGCAAVTLVGKKIRAILHELAPALEAFEEQKVHLVTQAANDLNLTLVVDAEHAPRLVKDLHRRLISRFRRGEVFGPTWSELNDDVSESVEAAWWAGERDRLLQLAGEHDSAYVYHRASVEAAAKRLLDLPSADRIFFAMKANSNRELLASLIAAGVNMECVSPGEIERVLEVAPGISRDRILFTPNFAPRNEYAWAFQEGVWVTLDNLHPLREWPELFAGKEILVRLDPGRGRGHHEHVKTGGVQSKFGVPLFEVEELRGQAEQAGASIVGFHAHTGSGVLAADNWRQVGKELLAVAKTFPNVRFLDLGGGLGVPEKPGEKPLDLEQLEVSLRAVKSAAGDCEIWLEPGRYLVAESGVLVSKVTQLKGKGHVRYVGVSTGMNSLIRPALYGAYHEIVNLTRLGEEPRALLNIVGPNCETGDRLGSERWLPETREGDVLLIANAGAYGYVMSSRYNLREPALEVVL